MSELSVKTVELHGLLDRVKAGDKKALDIMLKRVTSRLERLATKMLHQFPRVARWNDCEDVLQNASMRLIRALEEERPESICAFSSLAATQIRRELHEITKSLSVTMAKDALFDSLLRNGP